MGVRFQRRVRIAPGIRLNVSKSGIGFSVGPRGASVSVGPSGTWGHVGIPGTGLSYRQKAGSGSAPPRRSRAPNEVRLDVVLADDGRLVLRDKATGSALAPAADREIRRRHRAELEQALEEAARGKNELGLAVESVHLDTPALEAAVRPADPPFDEAQPPSPVGVSGGLLALVLPGRRAVVEARRAAIDAEHRAAVASWQARRDAHQTRARRLADLWSRRENLGPGDTATLLGLRLSDLSWPRETLVTYDVTGGGSEVHLDVDLPEIEDLPAEEAKAVTRGLKVTTKRLSDAALRRRYARHVHGIVFRLAGEVLALLPGVQIVQLSGYSQRTDPATGQVRDDYLLSVRVDRQQWRDIDVSALTGVDPVTALERFDLRRKMTKTGIFRPVEPFAIAEATEADRGDVGPEGAREVPLDDLRQVVLEVGAPMPVTPWAAMVNGTKYDGNLSRLRQWTLDGRVGRRDLVWTSALGLWTPAGQVEELDGYFKPSRKGLVVAAVGVSAVVIALLAWG